MRDRKMTRGEASARGRFGFGHPMICCEPLEPRRLLSFTLTHSTSTLPVAEAGMFAAAVGDEVVFGGGTLDFSQTRYVAALNVYNLRTHHWYSDPLPVRAESEVAVAEDHVLFNSADGVYDFNAATGAASPVTSFNSSGVYDPSVAVVGSKVIFAGGGISPPPEDFDGPSDFIDVYDTATGESDTTATLADPCIPYSDVIDGQAIFVGAHGYVFFEGRQDTNDSMDIYDASTDEWTTLSIGASVNGCAIANVGDQALFAGGLPLEGGVVYNDQTANVEIYHADTGQLTTALLSVARSGISSAVVGDKAIFAGGVYQTTKNIFYSERAVDIYDADTQTWSTASLAEARSGAISATAGNYVLFAGGEAAAPRLVDVYNASSNTWTTTTMPLPLTQPRAVALGQFVIFYDAVGSNIEAYNTSTSTWSTLATGVLRSGDGVVVADNQAIFAGGFTGVGPSDSADIFTRTYVVRPDDNEPTAAAQQADESISWLQTNGEVL